MIKGRERYTVLKPDTVSKEICLHKSSTPGEVASEFSLLQYIDYIVPASWRDTYQLFTSSSSSCQSNPPGSGSPGNERRHPKKDARRPDRVERLRQAPAERHGRTPSTGSQSRVSGLQD